MHQIALSLPLFILIAVGYGLGRFSGWPLSVNEGLNRLCFNVVIPCMLFNVMSGFYKTPPVDYRLLVAFFGSCFIVYAMGRIIAKHFFKLDPVSSSVFALGGIFSNNVMLGIPIATLLLGPESLPSIALVLIFNSLILWTLVTVSVEWARSGSFSLQGVLKTLISVFKNPIIIGIISGTAWSLSHTPLPDVIGQPVVMMGSMAAPLSLIALGMSLSHYSIREGLRESYAICLLKLLVQPLIIAVIALAIGLPADEAKVVVLLGSMAVGVNVYLMAQKFGVMQGSTASSTLFTTALSALSTPLFIMLMTQFYP
ncbi:AEC family transporter [Citrobacter sp. JGM124]|uniref:AEC family transporter n=1 Tax=Citrobacter sp. JGM124 TaxID=2799789 RepID=UPI001BA873F7|nr:AEC family transporter [Citrobacter sp. JGM124]MBS0848315.1 AEC family transporter [Citrobacter sp. JGM124]